MHCQAEDVSRDLTDQFLKMFLNPRTDGERLMVPWRHLSDIVISRLKPIYGRQRLAEFNQSPSAEVQQADEINPFWHMVCMAWYGLVHVDQIV